MYIYITLQKSVWLHHIQSWWFILKSCVFSLTAVSQNLYYVNLASWFGKWVNVLHLPQVENKFKKSWFHTNRRRWTQLRVRTKNLYQEIFFLPVLELWMWKRFVKVDTEVPHTEPCLDTGSAKEKEDHLKCKNKTKSRTSVYWWRKYCRRKYTEVLLCRTKGGLTELKIREKRKWSLMKYFTLTPMIPDEIEIFQCFNMRNI